MFKISALSGFWAIAVLFVLVFPATALSQDKHIDVYVDGNKLKFRNSECPDRPNHKGCIQAERDSSPNLTWELDAADVRNGWEFVSMWFSPDGSNWGNPRFPLEDCTMDAFDLEPGDKATGLASKAKVIANGQKLMIFDENAEPCQTHYKLVVYNQNSDESINSDPIIDNTGHVTRP